MLRQWLLVFLLYVFLAEGKTNVSIAAPVSSATSNFQTLAAQFNAAQSDIEVTVTLIPTTVDYYHTIKGALVLGDITFDGIAFGQVHLLEMLLAGVDSASNSDEWNLEPLTARVAASPLLDWDGINLFTRSYGTNFNKDVYLVPFDGDYHQLYLREDVLDYYGLAVPRSIPELVEVARALSASDMADNSSMPDVAFCVGDGTNLQRFVTDFTMPFIQYAGTAQGGYFTTDGMVNLFNNAGFKAGVEAFRAMLDNGYEDIEIASSREAFLNGTCAITIDWGDLLFSAPRSAVEGVANHTVAMVMPGSTRIYDRDSGRSDLVDCTATLCPFASANSRGDLVNTAPLASHGGWSIGVPKIASHKNEVFAFLEWAASPDVINPITLQGSGFEPFRTSVAANTTLWDVAGLSVARDWIMDVLDTILTAGNVALDMRLPGYSDYVAVMEQNLRSYLYDGESIDVALSNLDREVEAVTDRYGRDMQLLYYRMNLNVNPLTTLTLDRIYGLFSMACIIATAAVIIITTICVVFFGFIMNDGNFKLASPNYLILGNVGWLTATAGVALFVCSFVWSSTLLCINTLVFIGLGVAIALGSLFAKQARIYWILRATRSHKKRFTVPNDLHLLPLLLAGVPLPCGLVIVWSILDAFKESSVKLGDYTACVACQSTHAMLWAIAVGLLAVFYLVPNGLLVFKTRNLPISETRLLSISIQISAVMCTVIALVYLIAVDPFVMPKIAPPVFTVGVTLIQAVTFVPKLWKAVRRQPLSKRDFRLLTGKGDLSLDGYIRCPRCHSCFAAFGNQISKDEAVDGGFNESVSGARSHRTRSIRSALSSAVSSAIVPAKASRADPEGMQRFLASPYADIELTMPARRLNPDAAPQDPTPPSSLLDNRLLRRVSDASSVNGPVDSATETLSFSEEDSGEAFRRPPPVFEEVEAEVLSSEPVVSSGVYSYDSTDPM
ncbi:ABC transporter substrate-binding protein [Carpediemonas membranifera]|uniref:ABC transporter substrate-binding protein n=1 Tax=Carpediemonas membranifera TaxID=201153 RepID=A0A8J6AP61_9EUKA|nr:ABC transporter substrate-binding protein [Carpediemonas membranifera]|eukprot:KAG9389536.1 ABC transporter substrate-binding protein [Carpediemonas membranifera]